MDTKQRRRFVPVAAALGITPVAIMAVLVQNGFRRGAMPEGLVYLAQTAPPDHRTYVSDGEASERPASSGMAPIVLPIKKGTHGATVEAIVDETRPGMTLADLTVDFPGANPISLEFQPDRREVRETSGRDAYIVYLFDASGSLFGPLGSDPSQLRLDAAKSSMTYLGDTTQVAVGRFGAGPTGEDIQIGAFGNDHNRSGREMEALRNQNLGGTPLWDALAAALEEVRDQPGEKHIVLFSDGDDGGSDTTAADVVNWAKAADTKIHVVFLGSSDPSAIREIADETGGRFVRVGDPKGLDDAFHGLTQTIVHADDRSRYVLRFRVERKEAAYKIGERIDVPVVVRGRRLDLEGVVKDSRP